MIERPFCSYETAAGMLQNVTLNLAMPDISCVKCVAVLQFPAFHCMTKLPDERKP
jgi:hypothetical protein